MKNIPTEAKVNNKGAAKLNKKKIGVSVNHTLHKVELHGRVVRRKVIA